MHLYSVKDGEQPNKIRIEALPGGLGCKVWVNGIEMRYLTDVSISFPLNDVVRLKLESFPTEVVIEGDAAVQHSMECPNCKWKAQ